jgi:predicted O-linked N-acetylglucosamine transferase (SPINDLY family)
VKRAQRQACADCRGLIDQGEYAAATLRLQRLIQTEPDCGEAQQNLGKALFYLGQTDAAVEAFRKASALLGPSERTLGNLAIIIPGSPNASNQAVLEVRQAWAAHAAPAGHLPPTAVCSQPANGRRLRLGYVSSFLQHRNWMKPVWGLINHHDRSRFHIHLFSDAPESQVHYGCHKERSDRFYDISGQSNRDVARLIRKERIDILIDLNGYSQVRRLPLFALRPAPIIVSWFNMYATSGMDCFDYLIADEAVLPREEEVFYSETILRVSRCYLSFEVTYPVPEVLPAPCLTRGYITFGCLAPQYKINSQVVQAWAKILHGSPGSRLLLRNAALGSPANRRFVRKLFRQLAVPRARVRLEGPAEHYEFLKTYGKVDIALDTFPYNGGTTTAEALWQGVPVLTFSGDRLASRISCSLLSNAYLPEFVAPNLAGYVRRALRLANAAETPARLDALRRAMRERLGRAPVCDLEAFAREMEEKYLFISRRLRSRR